MTERYVVAAEDGTWLENHDENRWTRRKRYAARFTSFEEASKIAAGYSEIAGDGRVYVEAALTVRYVNAYAVSRNYGGPEEGGWWYDVGIPLASMPMPIDASDAEIENLKAHLTELIGWPLEPRQGRFSVNGTEDFEIMEEDGPAKAFPETRPHYE